MKIKKITLTRTPNSIAGEYQISKLVNAVSIDVGTKSVSVGHHITQAQAEELNRQKDIELTVFPKRTY